jgi:hypothetical protein
MKDFIIGFLLGGILVSNWGLILFNLNQFLF